MNVAVYCRVATRPQCDLPMVEEQKRLGEEKVKATPGEKLAGVFSDVTVPVHGLEDHPALTLLKRKCDQGEVEKVYAVTPSSISGNVLEMLDYILGLKKLGVPVEFSNGTFKLDMVRFDALCTLLDAFAAEEMDSN